MSHYEPPSLLSQVLCKVPSWHLLLTLLTPSYAAETIAPALHHNVYCHIYPKCTYTAYQAQYQSTSIIGSHCANPALRLLWVFFYQITLTEQTKQAILRTFLSRSLVETSIRSLTARKVPKMCTKQQQQKGLLSTEHLDFCYSSNHVTLHTLTSATLQKLMLHCFIPFLADVWQQLSREKQERTHAGQERKDGLVPNSLHVTSSYGRAEFGWTDSVSHKLQRPKEDFIPKEAKILTLYMKEKGMPRSSNIWLCWYGISVCLQEKFIAAAVK